MSNTSGAVDWPFCALAAETSSALEPSGLAELILMFGYFFSKPSMMAP